MEEREPEIVLVPITDDALYRFTCPQGHNAIAILQQMRFEVLAETAVQAIVDGFYRDAVTSFSASLERFHEFYLESVTLTRGVSSQNFANTWALVRNQSERQLGMFIAAYVCENNSVPALLPNQARTAGSVEFRNRVTHQGQIPTRQQAIEFGQAVIDLVENVLIGMRPRYADAMDGILFHHMTSARAGITAAEQNTPVSTACHPMVYRMVAGRENPMQLSAEVTRREGLRARRR